MYWPPVAAADWSSSSYSSSFASGTAAAACLFLLATTGTTFDSATTFSSRLCNQRFIVSQMKKLELSLQNQLIFLLRFPHICFGSLQSSKYCLIRNFTFYFCMDIKVQKLIKYEETEVVYPKIYMGGLFLSETLTVLNFLISIFCCYKWIKNLFPI